MNNRLSVAALLLTVVVPLGNGCITIQSAQTDSTPYLLSERGKVNVFTVAEMWTRPCFPIPVNSRETIFLIPGSPKIVAHYDLLAALKMSNGSRLIKGHDLDIASVARAMIGDNDSSVWWIISNDPDIIIASELKQMRGSNSSQVPSVRNGHIDLGPDLRFVTYEDLDHPVTIVRIIRRWKDADKQDMLSYDAVKFATCITTISLPIPKEIGEVMP